jgi:hypothetical protein
MRLKNLMAIFISLFLIGSSYGQGWEQLYHEDTISTKSIEMTADSGFFIAATRESDHGLLSRENSAYLIRTDVNGDTLWTKRIEDMEVNATTSVPGGYVLGGDIKYLNIGYDRKGRLVKVDLNGDTIWTKSYPYFKYVNCDAVIQTTDGGYLLAGSKRDAGSWTVSKSDVYVIKTNAIGDTLWTKSYVGIGNDHAYSVIQTADGGYLMTGYTESSGAGNKDVYALKIDALGNIVWAQTYGGAADDIGNSVISTTGGDYLIAGYTRSSGAGNKDAYLVKIDALGNVIWTKTYGGSNEDGANSVVTTTDGGYLLAGYSSSFGNGNGDIDVYVVKTNFLGVSEWFNTYGNTEDDYGTKGILASDGYAIVGWNNYRVGNLIEGNIYLIKTDSVGNTYTNYIKGNIFSDTSSNCLKEAGEPDLARIIVQAAGNRTWYGTTDSLGNYCIKVDTGTYVVTANVPLYWQSCNNIVTTIPLLIPFVNDTIDFPFQAQIDCPLMRVDLSAPLLRKANSSYYTISYCNEGTVDATNVVVKVNIDSALIVLNTTIPFSSTINNEYTFNLGTVVRGACGSFAIWVRVDSTAILGQTHCSEAHIYPDSLCLPNLWTGPIIDASATCQNDNIAFKLENIGGGLFNSETYYVFEDHVIMRTGNTGDIPVGTSFDLTIPADTGKTYRISVAQNLGFPKLIGDVIASAAIEGCVPYLDGTFNTGFITQFSNGNSSPFIAVDCQENISSFDPNDKSAQPAGYDGQHYIYDYTDLDYKIRFQNIGTDTAFLVVIKDVISPLLDLTTLRMGASSHAYTWRVYGEGILEITFDNILLPDSTVNEPASNGFVRYRIEQKDGNVSGDMIYNAADIYFDSNAPIRTNETYHTIGENFVTIVLNQSNLLDEVIQVKVYPNPFTQNATIEVEGKEYNELQLTVYDVSGRVVLEKQAYSNNKIELTRGNLQPGVYFYQLLGDVTLINTGKIIVQ